MNFKNSKTAKAISGFVGLATAVMMMGPAVASAATVAELTAQINALLAQVAALQASQSSNTTTTTSCSYVFTSNLKMGMSSSKQVMDLQMVLNMSPDTQVAVAGPGAPGNETKYFGGMTKAAVIKFQNKYAADILTPVGLTKGTGYVGASTRAKLNMMCSAQTTTTTSSTTTTTTTTGTTTPGATVSAMLDTASPVSSVLISPQGVATLAVFKLTNTSATPAMVTTVILQRTGISSDSTLNNVYLYNGSNRLTDSASISTGVISFTDTGGIVTIPAGASVSISVRADVATAMNGQTVGVMLTGVTASTGAVTGLPVSGSQQSIAQAPTGMTTVDFTGAAVTPTGGNVDPQMGYTLWQKNVSIGSRDARLASIRFQQLGSVSNTDVQNFVLMIDGTQVGSAVASVDANRYITFALPTPMVVRSGTHVIKVVGDIIGGSTRTVQLSLRRAIDLEIYDTQLGVAITPTVASATFSAQSNAAAISINAGTLTITKTTDSPSGNVVLQGSQVTLAKYTFHASGEQMKVENLTVGYTWNGSTTVLGKLRSASIWANGVQIGSTQDIVTTGTQFNLGSSLLVNAGVDVTVEIHADVYNSGAGGQYLANDLIVPQILAGTTNVLGKSSLNYSNVPASLVSGNTLTVASGSITLASYSAYANQTVTVPQTAYKLGDFRLTTGSTEGVNLDTITLALSGAATNVTNVYVVYGAATSQIKATGAASQTFSINQVLPANSTLSVAVYGTLTSSFTGSITPTLTMSGTSQSSGNAVTSLAAAGQTITVGVGAIASAVDASTPVSALVVANTSPKVASFKFTATNDVFTIDELTANVANAAAIASITWKDSATGATIATQPMNGLYATSSGLSIVVPSNTSKTIDAYVNLGSIGTGFASTSASIGVTLDGFESINSNGVKARDYTNRVGNAMYAYKTKPTITNVALPTTVLAAGSQTVAEFTVSADAGGVVSWSKIQLNVTATGVGFSSVNIYDAANQSTALANVTVATTSTTMTFTSSADQEVSGSKTYVVIATITGSPVTGNNFSTSFPNSGLGFVTSTTNALVGGTATLVWSDESSQPHSLLTQDWNNDYLVKTLPTTSQTMSK